MTKKQVRIACMDGVGYDIVSWFSSVLGKYSENGISEFEFVQDEKNPQFIIYSVFSTRHIHYDCVRIFYTAENCRADFNFCDYAITYDYMDFEDRHLRYPLYLNNLACLDKNSALYQKSNFGSEFAKRKFCSFVVSNGKADELRSKVFDALNAYKRVDSAGKFKNNMGFLAGDKIAFLKDYKFNICFENCYTNGYITEKIIDAKKANSVPIYWGGGICKNESNRLKSRSFESLRESDGVVFNKNAFVNLADFSSIDEMLEFVKYLDNDKNAYLAMLNEPLILDSQILEKNDKKLAEFLRNIFSAENPYCRGFGQWRMNLEKRYVRFQKTREIVNKIIDYYRKAIFLSFWKKLFGKKRK